MESNLFTVAFLFHSIAKQTRIGTKQRRCDIDRTPLIFLFVLDFRSSNCVLMTSVLMENFTAFVSPMAIDLCKDHPYYLLGDLIWRIGALLCVLLGMPGHVLIVLIMLSPKNRRQPICLYFATIAVCEFIYLISMLMW